MSLRTWIVPGLMIVLGTLQMAGDILDIPLLRALGAASGASPAPKVFTAQKGFETYSSRFYILWTDKNGHRHELEITPTVYRNVHGPYNRRNAYGAALSYAPVLQSSDLTEPLLNSVLRYTFCGESNLLEELGVTRETVAGPFTVDLRPRQDLPADHAWQLRYEISCDAQ